MDTRQTITDEELAYACTKGDNNALKELIEKYTTAIYNYARRMCGNDDEAQDITQDALIKVWSKINTFKNEQASFKTWMWRIVRNTTFDALRKHTRANTPFSSFDTEDENVIIDTVTDNTPAQDELYAQAEDAKTLESALQKLPAQARDVLLLKYREHMTFDEIGTTLGEPLNTVKSRHRRALERLKKILNNDVMHQINN